MDGQLPGGTGVQFDAGRVLRVAVGSEAEVVEQGDHARGVPRGAM